MQLLDAFIRRKQIKAEIETWIHRLAAAGKDTKSFKTGAIDGPTAFVPIPGSTREFSRQYTIQEVQAKIEALIQEDQELALRISLTNQRAQATLLDLDGVERTYTVPELLVLRNEIAPHYEALWANYPQRDTALEVLSADSTAIKTRKIDPVYERVQKLVDNNIRVEESILQYYTIQEHVDYGLDTRRINDEIDRIHEWLGRLKKALNEANKADLIAL